MKEGKGDSFLSCSRKMPEPVTFEVGGGGSYTGGEAGLRVRTDFLPEKGGNNFWEQVCSFRGEKKRHRALQENRTRLREIGEVLRGSPSTGRGTKFKLGGGKRERLVLPLEEREIV